MSVDQKIGFTKRDPRALNHQTKLSKLDELYRTSGDARQKGPASIPADPVDGYRTAVSTHVGRRDPRIVEGHVPSQQRIDNARVAHYKANVIDVAHETRPTAVSSKIVA